VARVPMDHGRLVSADLCALRSLCGRSRSTTSSAQRVRSGVTEVPLRAPLRASPLDLDGIAEGLPKRLLDSAEVVECWLPPVGAVGHITTDDR